VRGCGAKGDRNAIDPKLNGRHCGGRCRRHHFSMSRKHLLLATLCLLPAGPASAQILAGVPWPVRPAVVIDGAAGDARIPLVHAAVAHWNQILAGIGSGFRLGPVSTGGGAGTGKIQVVLSDGEFISNARRFVGGAGAVVMIRNTRGPPMSLPNVPRKRNCPRAWTRDRRSPQQRSELADVRAASAVPPGALCVIDGALLSVERRREGQAAFDVSGKLEKSVSPDGPAPSRRALRSKWINDFKEGKTG
jgi:hypothetical protein